MLCKCPVSHNSSSNYDKDITCHSLGCNIEAYPLINFCGVIGTGHNIEQKPTRYLVTSISIRTPQILQQEMAVEICKLAEQPKSKSNLPLKVTNRGVKRVVHIVSNESSEAPVVHAIAEHIGQGRGCMAEAMYKKCFHDSFEIVKTPVITSICLNWVYDTFLFVAKVLINREVEKDGVDYQRTQVLKKEESTVRNLGPQVLKHYSYGVGITLRILFEALLAVEDSWLSL